MLRYWFLAVVFSLFTICACAPGSRHTPKPLSAAQKNELASVFTGIREAQVSLESSGLAQDCQVTKEFDPDTGEVRHLEVTGEGKCALRATYVLTSLPYDGKDEQRWFTWQFKRLSAPLDDQALLEMNLQGQQLIRNPVLPSVSSTIESTADGHLTLRSLGEGQFNVKTITRMQGKEGTRFRRTDLNLQFASLAATLTWTDIFFGHTMKTSVAVNGEELSEEVVQQLRASLPQLILPGHGHAAERGTAFFPH